MCNNNPAFRSSKEKGWSWPQTVTSPWLLLTTPQSSACPCSWSCAPARPRPAWGCAASTAPWSSPTAPRARTRSCTRGGWRRRTATSTWKSEWQQARWRELMRHLHSSAGTIGFIKMLSQLMQMLLLPGMWTVMCPQAQITSFCNSWGWRPKWNTLLCPSVRQTMISMS